ncbi:MAG TPA: zinc ribbon domain-containing protein [Bryobacteraceae bacterium]|nr:zinc ribbon domain-containing protein [Bryobacteraceae bacterium]
MFCHSCGAQIQPDNQYCRACGTAVGGFQAAGSVPAQSRVGGHIRTLGIVWIVVSALRVLPAAGLHWFWHLGGFNGWPFWGGMPGHFLGFLGLLSGLWALTGVAGIVVGWGLLTRQPWARILAIVFGCIALIHIPFGTALGIYTLWVLLPAESEREYRETARV